MQELRDKVAVVTGAGRRGGIGMATAQHLAAAGAHVVLADLAAPPSTLQHGGAGQWEEMEAAAQELAAQGVRCLLVRCDVTQAASVAALVSTTMETFGRLDILVNNAGAAIGPAPVAQMAEEAWRRTLEINATGVFLCCKAALPAMIRGGRGGRIINMSSLAARRPRIFMSAYAASKAAVVALTESLAQEVASFGITVNAVLPGDIDTAFKQWGLQLEAQVMGRSQAEVTQALVARIPVGRMGSADDVANLVVWLASPAASFITGQAYNVTGGRELT